ncbi:MAG: tetrahydrofolate dehydrogenase/cyclohydrolase catalytic domain-containing protein [Patescibacteria group bacterium]|jgi:methylenetetrahydrofolate dehydrogenase (NADP+)/methenyltetrahydrofolate cyclohydrolase
MTQIIDGKKIAAEIRGEIKREITELGIVPGLAVILVGADPASHLYVGLKEKAAAEVGIHFEKYLFFATEPEEKIIAKIEELNARPDIHGIIVQLPLPQGYNENKIIAAIDPKKDADGFHPENIKKLMAGEPKNIPPVISGILKLIESTGTELTGKKIAILVNSEILAEPLAKILEGNQVSVTIRPEDPAMHTHDADIIVTALGRPKVITANAIKSGAILIDVGTTRLEDGKTVGDLDFDSVAEKAGWITPVPGGVGPMTVAMLLQNVLNLAK